MKPLAPAARIAAVSACILLAGAERAGAACDCVYQEPCTITTNIADFAAGRDRTMCSVRFAATQTAVAYVLTTARGERYRIENPLTIFDGWFINGEPGVIVRTNDAAHPCYRTPSVQICLGP